MSSLDTASRKTGRSRSPNPPLGPEQSSERGGQDESPALDPAPNASRRAAPKTTSVAATKPAPTTAKPAWGSGGRPTTTAAATRGRPSTRGTPGRPVNTSQSSTSNPPPVSPLGQTRSVSLARSNALDQPRSRAIRQHDALPHASAEPVSPIGTALNSTPRGTSTPQLAVTAPISTGNQRVGLFLGKVQLSLTFSRSSSSTTPLHAEQLLRNPLPPRPLPSLRYLLLRRGIWKEDLQARYPRHEANR